jgi:predicted alpha/beta-hydrolase family hydrolase
VAAAGAALAAGVTVALVEQPYRVAGRRSPAPANQLDAAWTAVVEDLVTAELEVLALVVGGRSLGARVACRTASNLGAAGVLCLAFPLRPPRRSGSKPSPSRIDELEAVKVPVLIVQGGQDPFGMPPASRRRKVVKIRGNHSLRSEHDRLAEAVREWLPGVLSRAAAAR